MIASEISIFSISLLCSKIVLSEALPPYGLLMNVIKPPGDIPIKNCIVKVDL